MDNDNNTESRGTPDRLKKIRNGDSSKVVKPFSNSPELKGANNGMNPTEKENTVKEIYFQGDNES